jgi:hypothetical protein
MTQSARPGIQLMTSMSARTGHAYQYRGCRNVLRDTGLISILPQSDRERIATEKAAFKHRHHLFLSQRLSDNSFFMGDKKA